MSLKRLASALGLAFLLLALAPNDAAAQKGKKKADMVMIKELRASRFLLQTAFRDYKGHRAKATNQVTEAIHQLLRDMGKKPPKKGMMKGPGPNKSLTQAQSDAQLAQAKTNLAKVLQQINGLPPTKHRSKAAIHLESAIIQIDKALAVK
jgi:hypothetical protein